MSSATRRQLSLALGLVLVLAVGAALGQRDNDDDFDDAGFDDSGYGNQPSREAEESNQNPSNYSPSSEEDLDDDEDVDDTLVSPQVAPEAERQARGFYRPQVNGPQRFYAPANSLMLANVHQRYRRSADERDVEDPPTPLVRSRRHAKHYIGPVYTYVKTDKHAHYKWGVKHKVGKHYG